jgi:hypothetical protein
LSIDALKYIKDLNVAPNGEPIDLREKALLWYLANSHNEEKRCAWPSNKKMALANNISKRTVQEILKECVRKGIVWRRETFRDNGSLSSNEWRFTDLDGGPTSEDLIAEEKRRIRGEQMAAKANARRPDGDLEDDELEEISTEDCGSQRSSLHQASAGFCATPCEIPHDLAQDSALPSAGIVAWGSAESLATSCGIPHDQNYKLTASGSFTDFASEDLLQIPSEATGAAAEENSGRTWPQVLENRASDEARDEQLQYARLWRQALNAMLWVVGERVYIELCTKTRMLTGEQRDGKLRLTIGVAIGDQSLRAVLDKNHAALIHSLREQGFEPELSYVEITPEARL